MDIYLLPSSQIKLTVSEQVFSFGVSVTFSLQKKIFLIEKSVAKYIILVLNFFMENLKMKPCIIF